MKMQNKFKRIAIKIGSNVLAQSDGSLNEARISHLVGQISGLIKNRGDCRVIRSSGRRTRTGVGFKED